ncbi:unnamed protein product [Spirodela intermedia]|uniref:Uncharacterized protein n=1 Tax=Spirodela intermedia TaxID=51605 RepID=A0A7I8IKS7_SPIIN|nr:unnamed protein product [Spirodela intermedia]CAA6658480.1 unnamed protein product [Spirodela intermedia]
MTKFFLSNCVLFSLLLLCFISSILFTNRKLDYGSQVVSRRLTSRTR